MRRTDLNFFQWSNALTGTSPTPFPRRPSATYQSMADSSIRQHFHLSRAVTGLTMAPMIRAAWAIVVAKYSDSTDIVYGTTLAGRNVPVYGIENMPGPTITTVPVRICVDPSQSLIDFLRSVQNQAIEMIPFEHLGLQKIKCLSSDAQAACDFHNLLVVQPPVRSDSNGILLNPGNYGSPDAHGLVDAPSNFNTYAVTIECTPTVEGLDVAATFDAHVVDEQQMQRILQQFGHVLRQLCEGDPDNTKLGDIRVLSPEDEEELLGWNSELPSEVAACVHALVEKSALRRPLAPAICSWDGDLSYKILDELSTQLADRLVPNVRPGVIVPICFDKSKWAVVAMLAVLKAGGACASLEPSHPEWRRLKVLRATAADLVVTSTAHAHLFAEKVKHIITVDQEHLPIDLETTGKHDTPGSNVLPEHPAFVVFTSGTTGNPKGILLSHSAICTSAAAHGAAMQIGPQARVLQFASYSFDVSIGDIFTTLVRGGCVCIPSEDARFSKLAASMNEMKVTHAYFTPTVLGLLKPEEVKTLRFLSVGGESVRQDNIALWAGRERVQMINIYGPAECAIWCTFKGRLMMDSDPADIGSAIGCVCWVVNPVDHHELMPIGAVGELLVEGPVLAMGYIGDQKLTDQCFVRDPAWPLLNESSRHGPFYKTGDIVRYNSEGSLVFVGRKDNQVKLRGQRIELGEIEHLLADHFQMNHVCALVPSAGAFGQQLVGVVCVQAGLASALSTAKIQIAPQDLQDLVSSRLPAIHTSLLEKLPLFMIPTTWAFVTSFPLLASGKLDRSSLSSWLSNISEDDAALIRNSTASRNPHSVTRPVTPMEGRILDLCGRVLGQPSISFGDSFLGLGGDSMSALRLMARCKAEGISVMLHDILQSKNLRQLSGHAQLTMSSSNGETTTDEAANFAFALSPIQQIHFETSPRGNNMFSQSRLLRLLLNVSLDQVAHGVKILVDRHAMLRARFHPTEPSTWVQTAVAANPDAYRVRYHEVANVEAMAQLIKSAQAGLDIRQGPVFTVDMFTVGTEHFVLFVMHHLVTDIVSWGIVLQEIEEHLLSGRISGPMPMPFRAWCKFQTEETSRISETREEMPSDTFQQDFEYWGMSNTPNIYEDATSVSVTLGHEVTAMLFASCNEALKTEPLEVMISALVHSFLTVFPDRSAVTIFNEKHGRNSQSRSVDTSRTVGWFTTLQPLSIQSQNEDINIDFVRRVKDLHQQASKNNSTHLARSHGSDAAYKVFEERTPMEIVFNFHGRGTDIGSESPCFRNVPLAEVGAAEWPWAGERMALFEISAVVEESALRVSFTFSRKMRHQSRIHAWIRESERTLGDIVQKLVQTGRTFTLNDFSLIPFTYASLDNFTIQTLPKIGISTADVEDLYPCSPVQEGILLSQAKQSEHYKVCIIFEVVVPGTKVHVQRLIQAWQRVIDFHPILRTTFLDDVSNDGRPVQLVLRQVVADTVELDCATDVETVDKLRGYATMPASANRPSHQLVICISASEKVFCRLELDHAITDGGSNLILLRDLRDTYNGVRSKALDGPRSTYKDYVSYLKRQSSQTEYWHEYLRDVEPCHFPLTPVESNAKDTLRSVSVPFHDRSLLSSVCRKHEVTESMIFMACWSLLLRAYIGSDSICFGYLVSGRDLPLDGVEDAVGPFINLLPCQARLLPTQTVMEVVKDIQSDFTQGLRYRAASMAEIQRGLGLRGQQLFNTAMSLQNRLAQDAPTHGMMNTNIISGQDPTEVSRSNCPFNDSTVSFLLCLTILPSMTLS